MNSLFLNLIGQTWLLSAQLFSTREFEQLAVQRLWPKYSIWFTILIFPIGLAIDGTVLHLEVSVGIMGILYVTTCFLSSKVWEHRAFGVAFLLALIGISTWTYGKFSYVLTYSVAFIALVIIATLILRKYTNLIGVAVSLTLSILMELLISLYFDSGLKGVAVTLMTSIMSGLYVAYRSFQDNWEKDTNEAVQYDALTQALSRRGLSTWIEKCKAKGESEGIIIFCDLDHFKWINDTWGHEVGDRVLKAFVFRISQGLRASDAISRFGGDEFQIWMPMKGLSAPEEIVHRLHTLASQGTYEMLPDGNGLKIGVSMGWTYGSFTEEKANEADYALLEAKQSGKNRVCKASRVSKSEGQLVRERDPQLIWLKNITESLWSGTHYPFVLTDKSGRIIVANEAYEHLVGRSLSELLGHKPGINSAKKTPKAVYKHMWSNLTQGKPWSGCLLNKREDGTEWWELCELFPILLSGQIIGYWGLAQELAHAHFPPAPLRHDYKWYGNIEWAFQPIVDVQSENVTGYEALARPTWGTEAVAPDMFFRIAECFEFRENADWECMESLLVRLKTVSWPNGKRLFLNVFADTFQNHVRITSWLERFYQILPDTVCVFEILEHHVHPIDLDFWKELQVKYPLIELAQDDFGIGEQDLVRLVEVKPDWIKLDRQWVSTLSEHPESRSLLASVSRWAAEEGLQLILEGVETEEDSRLTSLIGIHHEQGYFWSKPLKEPNYALRPKGVH
ncbi:diguanylate cyclase (GGDEF)-like protein/PAS domain S-box-containing protein [Pullulanibacillus pueri]|uniref:Uncharacterized protein n=1 Tax=Pullulanibacillus pueri TaxID=1437324 RepID=A0A8J3A3K2_9BACL|nr:diguanylate cyclase [Pullulanibacillus pueri]MBM7684259.1 diguanylate cyclase (GGDEF)-like protein/PAS domain S-box-containing protein [Pullulanibacillus pueri]GGH89142.1 hypothetical protein GCM10007096_43060 [Pullulanibacillus pueri]